MIGALVSGDLVSDPIERATSKGGRFLTATLRVPAGAEALFVGIACFDATGCERLGKLRKGSPVAAVGVLEQTSWTGKDGAERQGWRLTASEVLTVYAARKRREPEAAA